MKQCHGEGSTKSRRRWNVWRSSSTSGLFHHTFLTRLVVRTWKENHDAKNLRGSRYVEKGEADFDPTPLALSTSSPGLGMAFA